MLRNVWAFVLWVRKNPPQNSRQISHLNFPNFPAKNQKKNSPTSFCRSEGRKILGTVTYLPFQVCCVFGCSLFPSKRAPKHARKCNTPEIADSGNDRWSAFSGVLRLRVCFGTCQGKSWFSGRGWGQQLFSFQSPAVHRIARTSSLNCLSCRNPYQTPHSLNCLPPFHWKAPFLHWKVLRRIPFPKNRLNQWGKGALWDSSLPVSLTLWDTSALFTPPLALPQIFKESARKFRGKRRRTIWNCDLPNWGYRTGIAKQIKWLKNDSKMTFQRSGESDSKMAQHLTFSRRIVIYGVI